MNLSRENITDTDVYAYFLRAEFMVFQDNECHVSKICNEEGKCLSDDLPSNKT